ncbi:T6SS effector BTH_I2691 family protein [Luteimonas sp. R10]|uniref:T6SS effector BTH_I2691 family protein n=1 Tax=Luteimonas sp. R10 TaxID=3108176 RepID=UPI00308B69DF|nr:T6SS effector BTH_I2691 family protein [Luteimonas sp. R10]
MADGQGPYSINAQNAAAGAPSCSSQGCPACQKVGLPVLLVRPGVADSTYANSGSRQQLLNPLFKHELAMPVMTTCGYVARSLRPGYVLAYYEQPHTAQLRAQQGWEVFKVYPGGYMEPFPLEGGQQETEDDQFTCSRVASYATAMLFVIQDAKRAGKVWVAYSDHVWSQKIRDEYQSKKGLRSKRMTLINASKAKCEQSIPLTESNLQQVVAEYDPRSQTPFPMIVTGNPFKGNPFEPLPFAAMPGLPGMRPERANDMQAAAQSILGKHNDLSGHSRRGDYPLDAAMIVGVTDAIGVTSETAHRRVTLCNTAAEWVAAQQDGYHRFQSAMTIEGLLKLSSDQAEARKKNSTDQKYAGMNGKEVSEREFEELQSSGKIPGDATLEPIYTYGWDGPHGDGRFRVYGRGKIRFVTDAEIDEEARDLEEDILDGLSGKDEAKDYRTFLNTHKSKAEEDDRLLARIEVDYRRWLQSDQRKHVTSNDFDETTPSDGIHYGGAVAKVTFGGPISDNGVAWFEDFLLKDPDDKEALLVRALLGNQKSAIEAFKPTKIVKQTKTFFSLIEKIEEAAAKGTDLPPGDDKLLQAFPEIRIVARQLPLLRNLAAVYGHLNLGVAGATAMALDKLGKIESPFRDKVQALVEGIADTLAEKAGIALHKVSVPIDVGARYWRRQLGHVRELARRAADAVDGKQVKSLVMGGAMWFDIGGRPGMADAVVDFYVAVRRTSGQAVGALDKLDEASGKAAAGAGAAANRSADAVSQLARTLGKNTKDMVRESIQVFKQGGATLSAAGGVLQALSIGKAWEQLENGDAEERASARISLLSAGLGLTAAMMEVSEAYAKRLGKTVAATGMKVVAGLASTVVLTIDAIVAIVSAFDESAMGDRDVARMRWAQAIFFLGAAVASGMAVGAAAGWITGTIAAGWGLSWTGWGLLLVGLGLIAGWVAMMLDDPPTVEWVKQSIWGSGRRKWGSLQREQNELNKILLGVRIDFHAGDRMTLSAGTVGLGAPTITRVPTGTYEAWVRLFLPPQLRDKVKYELGFTLRGTQEQRSRWKFNHRTLESGEVKEFVVDAPGMVISDHIEDGESIKREMEVERNAIRAVFGSVRIWDAPEDGDLIIDETLSKG